MIHRTGDAVGHAPEVRSLRLWRITAAWTGHAASTPYTLRYLHLASDALHLTAASAWIGGLVPFALLLGAIRCHRGWAARGPYDQAAQ